MTHDFDVLIIGGGPGGSTAALVLARAGIRVGLLEKTTHPRFHIGESILPRNMDLIRDLGLQDELRKLPQLAKYGAEFGIGNDPNTMTFLFSDGLIGGSVVFNIERSKFDKMLLDQARNAGATVLEEATVKQILKLEEGSVELSVGQDIYRGKLLLDASGHGTVVGRHLKHRRNFDDPELQKVAYFQQFDHVERLPGIATGHPTIFMCKEGWFWIIGLTDTKTSVGFVTQPEFVKQLDVPPDRLLQWAVARCPVVRHRMRNATGASDNMILSNFSYTCKPFAGPGYFLVGDAGCFLDPIFSTGVTLAMIGGRESANHTINILKNGADPRAAQQSYIKFIQDSTGIFWTMIRSYYKHSFRELFMNGRGPLKVHNAIISILAGHVFPKPAWGLRWRMKFFQLCVWTQQFVPLCPRRPECSLLTETPVELPAFSMATQSA